MDPTPKDALSVETRRRGRLLWLNSLKVLSKALVVGIIISGASHGLPNIGQADSTPRPSARSRARRKTVT